MAVSLVMGNMIGSGVFLLPASLAGFGGMSLLGWLVSATGAVCLALVFARLARFDPAAGGPYAFTRRAFGDFAGFLVGWGYWIAVWTSCAALAVACVGYLDPFFPALVRNPITAAMMAAGALWVLTAVNVWGVRAAGRVQVVTTALKVVPLALVGIGGLFVFDASHFTITQATPRAFGGGLSAVATLTLWAFLGLESATVPSGSIDNPDRTIPRATIVGTLLAALIYIVSTVGVMSVIEPSQLANSTAPFADAARVLLGDRAAALVAIGAAISCFGALNGWILIVGPGSARCRERRVVSSRLRPGGTARDADRRAHRVERAHDAAACDELLAGPRGPLHVRHPALDAQHAGAVRVLDRWRDS